MPVGKSLSGTLRILPWDSFFWGFRVAGWAAQDLTISRLRRGLQWCRQKRVRCLYCCVDGEDAITQQLLQQEGFVFVDIRTEMRKKPLQSAETFGGFLLKKARPRELPALQRLASLAHVNTRFAKDRSFPRVGVRRLYSLWLAKAARKGAVQVLAGRSKLAAGYIVCEMESRRVGRVGLIAVSPRARGRGLGRDLLRGAEDWLHRRGAGEIRAVTQGLSKDAVRMYEVTGFRVTRVQVWFHRWFIQ